MADITAEGTLYVDLVDLWQWLEQRGIDGTQARSLRFSKSEQALVIEGPQSRSIDAAEFWQWLIEHQLPGGFRGQEIAFGPPSFHTGELRISFAVSSVSSPFEWDPKPECISQWDDKRD